MMKTAKEQQSIKNTTTRDFEIVVWLKDEQDRPLYIEAPDDLTKIGVTSPDWKTFKVDHIICDPE